MIRHLRRMQKQKSKRDRKINKRRCSSSSSLCCSVLFFFVDIKEYSKGVQRTLDGDRLLSKI